MVANPTDSFQLLVEDSRKDYEQIQKDLKEIDLLIQQTATEVDRLAQRNAQATNRLRQVEANLNSISSDDIQDCYSTVLDTQQRLFTMRGQLEKLQSDQRNLDRHSRMLWRIIGLGSAGGGDDEGKDESASESVPTIVRIIEAQERERQHMARQMHDGPAQALTNLVLQAEICERLFSADPERARVELTNLKTAVAGTFERVRGFISDLRPMMLDDLGLLPTLKRFIEDFDNKHDIQVNLVITGREQRFASYKEVTIFRLVQSLLNNARDISHAANVQVNLDVGEDRVQVSVEDDGSGFDIPELTGGPVGEEMGLATMRERVEMLNGQFEVESSPGRGTRISFKTPLP
ncbi:MAG: sensor histidine kinase [Anaerolineae bacterium]|nr:sensor histidine kinase [Anaerolineae bacterium]